MNQIIDTAKKSFNNTLEYESLTQSITLRKPDDWHVHLRDGELLKATLPCTANTFGRAIVMPNLTPPVVTTKQALAYRATYLFTAARRQ